MRFDVLARFWGPQGQFARFDPEAKSPEHRRHERQVRRMIAGRCSWQRLMTLQRNS